MALLLLKRKFKWLISSALTLILTLSLASCTADLNPDMTGGQIASGSFDFTLDATLQDITPDDETKASVTTVVRLSWNAGDQISVVNLTTGKALGGSLTANEEGTTTTFSGTLTGTVNNGDRIAFIYPSQGYTEEQDYQPVTVDFSKQAGNSNSGVPLCVYSVVTASGSTFSRTSASFKFLMSYLQMNLFGLEAGSTINSVTMDNIGAGVTLNISSDGVTGTPVIGTITMTPPSSYKVKADGTRTFYMSFAGCDAVSKRTVIASTANELKACDWTGSKLNMSTSYTSSLASFVGVKYIDLGLPSGIKWATMNIGASAPEEYGDYYAFGEVTTKSSYDWENYIHCSGTQTSLNKYCTSASYGTVDNKIELDRNDDAASVIWGEHWRTPTFKEQQELLEKCTWTWTTMNGMKGYKVTGPNGNSIFLPAAGYRNDTRLLLADTYGRYWSSSLSTSTTSSGGIIAFGAEELSAMGATRYFGRTIRPVYSEDNTSGITGLTLDNSTLTLDEGDTEDLVAVVDKRMGAVNDQVEWSSSDTSIATVDWTGKVTGISQGSATITAKTVFGGYSATCEVTVNAGTSANGYKFVDLGLSVKWATTNIGAANPEEPGNYYQWAGTQDVSTASLYQDNCPYHTGSSSTTKWTRYIPSDKSTYWSGKGQPDNQTVLFEGDDAAHVAIGGKWRMPTIEEFTELKNNCTVKWTSDYNGSGIKGVIITSKVAGYEDKSIFLPTAGSRYYSSFYNSSDYGYYWSSSLNTAAPEKAYYYSFQKSGNWSNGSCERYKGLPIRPVYDENYHEHTLVPVPAQTPTQSTAGWKSCYKCSECGKYFEDENGYILIGDESAYIEWKSRGGNGFMELPQIVDLGLSVKWASCNVGADNAYTVGDYYAWGETSPKSSYSSSNYSVTKYYVSQAYGTVDNRIILEQSDDAASANWGGNWRMPTYEELSELHDKNNCTWTLYDEGNTEFNGIKGYKVQSLKSGYTNNYIFIPYAGRMREGSLESNFYIWSSSLETSSNDCARAWDNSYSYNIKRYYGLAVRPVYSSDKSCGVTGISLDKSSLALRVDDVEKLTATVSAKSTAVNKQIQWSSSNPSVATVDYNGTITAKATGNATISVKTVFGGFSKSCSVTVSSAPTEHDYVDLGLSVKWATCNVGANKPYDFGKYYAWGETKAFGESDPSNPYCSADKTEYWWSTYKHGGFDSLNKYCIDSYYGPVDNRVMLESADDAAAANWGGNWRMPTDEELGELYTNCSMTWYAYGNTEFNGTAGVKVQSNVPGYTDNYIFLPAAGYYQQSTYQGDRNSYGYYWSSSVSNQYSSQAFDLYIGRQNADYVTSAARPRGQSVRPVYSEDPDGGVTGISLDKTSATMRLGDFLQISPTVSKKAGAVNRAVIWTSSNPSVATVTTNPYSYAKVTALSAGTATITARTAWGGFEATCTITVSDPVDVNAEYVDLGLPSGTLWAAYNIGASSPEGYGDYFSWGETSPGTYFSWGSYKHCNGSSSTITKYNTSSSLGPIDNKTTLELIDDTAYLNWGKNWRMPTDEEWTELRNYCDWTWTSLNGVNGYLVSSQTNSSSIFLPAAGCGYGNIQNEGSTGEYWSSSLYNGRYAWSAGFTSSSAASLNYLDRYHGHSVRAVRR